MRTDAPLIKHLAATISTDAAGVYNRLPLFVMPEESEDLMQHEADLLSAAPETFQLPFEDFLLDFPFGAEAVFKAFDMNHTRGRLWVRVRSLSAFRQDEATQIASPNLSGSPDDWLLLEGWEESTTTGGLPVMPDHTLIPSDVPGAADYGMALHAYPNPECFEHRIKNGVWCNLKHCRQPNKEIAFRCTGSELFHSCMTRLTVLSLIYLSEGLGGVTTRIAHTPRPGSREEKTERLKPWVAPRRETYIIIDPERARDYGHPSGELPDTLGHHASPIPNARRGHWRKLAPDRKTWVRPAWIGVREWQHEGQSYKILLHKEEK